MKNLLKVIVVLMSLTTQAQELSPAELINIAGKQRMLSQQITKTFNMVIYGATNDVVKKEMMMSNKIFQKNMKMIKLSLVGDNGLYAKSNDIENIYRRFNATASTFVPTDSEKLMKQSNMLLERSEDLVSAIISEKTLGDSNSNLDIINLAGRQRMLQQKLASLFMAKKANERLNNKDKYHVAILPVINEIESAINKLSSFSGNTIDIDMQLAEISLALDLVLKEKYKIINGEASINFVYRSTNKITRMYDKLVSTYVKEFK